MRLRDLPVGAIAFVGLALLGARGTGRAWADGDPAAAPTTPPTTGTTEPVTRAEQGHLQYGAALGIELLASAGPSCPEASTAPCVIGSGGGLAVRTGYRFHGPLYLGGAYEFSKHDANKLLRLPILQQFRAELRFALPTKTSIEPYLSLGGGLAAYGSEWEVTTSGPLGMAGFGIEAQLSRTSVFTASVAYRPLYLHAWVDPAGQDRPASLISFVGLELGLEQRASPPTPSSP